MGISIVTLVFEMAALAFINVFFQLSGTAVSSISACMVIFFAAIYCWNLPRYSKTKDVGIWLALGFLLRIALMFWDIYCSDIFTLPNSGGDAVGFYSWAVTYAKSGYSKHYFSQVMGTIYRFIGINRVYGQFLIVLCSVVSLHMANGAMLDLGLSPAVRKRGMFFLALLPNFAILSSIFLRESIVAMFASVSVGYFIKWLKGASNRDFVIAFISVFLGSRFHSGVVGIAGAYIVVLMFYNRKTDQMNLSWKRVLPAVLFILIFAFVFNNYSDKFFGKMTGVDSISDVANTSTVGGSSYARYVGNSNNIFNMVIYTPLRIVFFLFSPFPWMWRGLSDIIAFCFSSCFYILAIWSGIKAVAGRGPNKNILITLFIVAACTVFIFAWGVSNTGTAARHRDKMIVLYGIIYALSYSDRLALAQQKEEVIT